MDRSTFGSFTTSSGGTGGTGRRIVDNSFNVSGVSGVSASTPIVIDTSDSSSNHDDDINDVTVTDVTSAEEDDDAELEEYHDASTDMDDDAMTEDEIIQDDTTTLEITQHELRQDDSIQAEDSDDIPATVILSTSDEDDDADVDLDADQYEYESYDETENETEQEDLYGITDTLLIQDSSDVERPAAEIDEHTKEVVFYEPEITHLDTSTRDDILTNALLEVSQGRTNALINTIELGTVVEDDVTDLQLVPLNTVSSKVLASIESGDRVQDPVDGDEGLTVETRLVPYDYYFDKSDNSDEYLLSLLESDIPQLIPATRNISDVDTPEYPDHLKIKAPPEVHLSLIPRIRPISAVSSPAKSDRSPKMRLLHSLASPPGGASSVHYVTGKIFMALKMVHQAMVAQVAYRLPQNFRAACASADARFWRTAIAKELQAHSENNTWSLVSLPAGRRAIGCRWVFTIKDTSSPPLYKARLVAQGFRQIHGIDYGETFSPVVRYESIRVLFALAAQFGLAIHQMDVTTAFLNGDLDEEIYMQVPDGVSASPGMVCKLNKSLYGLKQAPLCWNNKINHVLLHLGFHRSSVEFGIYSKRVGTHVVLVALYVDDLLILSNQTHLIQTVKSQLSANFKMKDLGLVSTFLGMQISQSSTQVSVHLHHYLSSFLAEFNMSDCNSVTTPLPSNFDSVPNGTILSPTEASRYRTMVGKLLFAANTVRFDLAYATSVLSRFIREPHANHLAAAKHVLRYIKGNLDLGLVYTPQKVCDLVGYCDSDWAHDKIDRKSVTGYTFTMSGAAVTWRSTKQKTVAQSSSEAEYMALGEAVKESLWLKQLLEQIGLKAKKPIKIYEDNQGAIALSSHPSNHSRTKHIDIRHHFIRDHVAKQDCEIEPIRTDEMIADVLTKNLGRIKFSKFVKDAGMKKV